MIPNMSAPIFFLNPAVTAFWISVACLGGVSPAAAQGLPEGAAVPTEQAQDSAGEDADASPVDRLLRELRKPDQPGWQQIEEAILAEWSKSGSAAMDLLLCRGQKALGAGDHATAIDHLTALTDHAPGFAEGWNARATAFFHADRYGEALEDIERVLALEPRHFGALTGLAIILEQIGYPKDALDAWRAVEAIHPHQPDVKEAIERLQREVEGRRL